MRFVGNIIWFIFGGAVLSLMWLLGAVLFALTIVGLPLSRGAIEMAKLSAFPFGKEVVHVRELDGKGVTAVTALTGTIGFVVNVIWACTFGIGLFVGHLVAGVINCIFIITIPFGIQSFKLAGLSFWPVGRRVVSVEMARIAREHNAQEKFSKIRAKSGSTSVVAAK
ncbi:YccF family protein [Rhizobium laguerreae]|uniref:YccF family protein n=1 Tax=Rhizobium laguerreae TaxID=1076926 RepID=UPI001C90F40F|nr:YccF family protein [Rhizobium laguerreae]MBY3412326.1 YccF family protein [Rhizobium laguerreae]